MPGITDLGLPSITSSTLVDYWGEETAEEMETSVRGDRPISLESLHPWFRTDTSPNLQLDKGVFLKKQLRNPGESGEEEVGSVEKAEEGSRSRERGD